jgi:hypothetical protein
MRGRRSGEVPPLPVELWWMVLDWLSESTSFAEHVALGQVCKSWRSWSDGAFPLWLSKQAVGRRLKCFTGSGYELGFVMGHVKGKVRG